MATTLIANATLISGDGHRTDNTAIVVTDGKIAAVEVGRVSAPSDNWDVVDASGCSVMPGMFNCHYHSTYRMNGTMPLGMDASPGLLTIRAVHNMGLALDSGFTSVVSAGAPFAVDVALKEAIRDGLIRGPRMMAGSRDLSTTGHAQDLFFPWYWDIKDPPALVRCDGADQFRRGVREEVKRGAEIIKMFATAGHGVSAAAHLTGNSELTELTREEFAAAIDTAHERGVKIRAHVANKKSIILAVELGIDVIDHGDGLDEECIQLMAERGTVLAPSCVFPYALTQSRSGPGIDLLRKEMEAMLAILPVADKAGVKIVLGDDYGAPILHHGTYGKELGFYVKNADVSPQDVIRWATKNGADLMGMSEALGDIRPGMLADLVIVKGDPIADIALVGDPANILAVMKNGQFEKRNLESIARQCGPFANEGASHAEPSRH